jgi:hypothetical protein
MSFFFSETENRMVKLGGGSSEREEDVQKGSRRANVVEILCTHV